MKKHHLSNQLCLIFQYIGIKQNLYLLIFNNLLIFLDKDGASNSLEKEFETFQRKSLGQPQTFNLSGLLHELQPPTKVNL